MTLKHEQMAQLRRLLDEALALDETGRRQWLDNLPPEHGCLSEALRAALFPEATRRENLSALPKLVDEHAPSVLSQLEEGARIGPYQLERLLGSGGMAEVWLATRADGAFRREVALKLPLVSRLRQDLHERFARERDILAALEHPNIARLYDGGVDAHGLPYLAMEYVQGEPITSWCDARCVPIAERLKLLIQVLEAAQYAHERAVVHRDLKPSNILVNQAGQVRLLDFGLAKLLEAAEGQGLTQLYGRAFTPDYASPEQLRGTAVDARSDIYSIGVLLYRLLTGTRPYRLEEHASAALLEQAILTVEVQKPSTQTLGDAGAARALTEEKLIQQLRGDLDVITLKALAKDPAERYDSAAAMAADVSRYLHSRPIKARPAPLAYRVKKFVARNRPVIAVSALAGVLVFAIGGYELAHRLATPALPPALPFNPSPRSIAVLAFTNLSGDPKQEYFSDGMSEELINALSQINSLEVIARTSSFSFKGQNVDIGTIARKLNVGTILEGSIRRSGDTVRITAQLINAVTGFRMWSEHYDRNLKNVLELQSDIATTVAQQLQARLLGGEASEIEAGGTRNPEAYDDYLRGSVISQNAENEADQRAALIALERAIMLDPDFAAAYALKATKLIDIVVETKDASIRDNLREQARSAAERAVALAPNLSVAHLSLWFVYSVGLLDFSAAQREMERALALAPGNAQVQVQYGVTEGWLGHFAAAEKATRRAISLDPQNFRYRIDLVQLLHRAHRFDAAVSAAHEVTALKPQTRAVGWVEPDRDLALGQPELALRSCESAASPIDDDDRYMCLAIAYRLLGRYVEAERELATFEATYGDAGAVRYAMIYAQWGDRTEALRWLVKAEHLRDPGLQTLKVDWHLDPLRDEPAFQDLERRLHFLT